MSGGKGGSQSTEIPGYLEDFQKRNIGRGEELADIGYMPWTGIDVAGVNDWERLGASQQNAMSDAFGLGTVAEPYANMPAEIEQGGMTGYSSYPMFAQAVDALDWAAPEYSNRYREQFDVPSTGSIYGRVGDDGLPTAAPAPADYSGMNNGQLLDVALDGGAFSDFSDEEVAVINSLASDPSWRDNGGLLSYDPTADLALYDPEAPETERQGISPEYASFIQRIQQRILDMQQPTQRGGIPGQTARNGQPFGINKTRGEQTDEFIRQYIAPSALGGF